jgi:predicted small secreted protein
VVRLFNKLSLTLLLVVGTFLLAACPTRTSIGRVIRDPGRYAGREVAIGGRVSNSFGALGTGVYQLDDGTGQIWVYSQRYGVPGNGAKVGVRGTISQGFSFGGRSFAVVLRETERRH